MGEHPGSPSTPFQDVGHLQPLQQAAAEQDSNPGLVLLHEPQAHEGRLLQVLPNVTGNPAAANFSAQDSDAHTFLQSHTNSSSTHNHSTLFPKPSHLELHHVSMAAPPITHAHASNEDTLSRSVHDTTSRGSARVAREALSGGTSPHHPHSHVNEDVNARNQTVALSDSTADLTNTHMHDHAPSRFNSTSSSAQQPTLSDVEACSPHLDLPVPGMDIALANVSKCYTHPAQYKNANYLNDSFYMLYHHDGLPAADAHPAYTWGDISRFTHAMYKMKRNDPVKAIFVGGSVSSSYCRQDLACMS